MAREFTDLLAQMRAHYPTLAGGPGQDTTLATAAIRFTNSLLNTIDTERRWSLSYGNIPTPTVAGTSQYAIPTGMTAISHLYWLGSVAGAPVTMESYDINELRRQYGDGASAIQGPPRYFAVIGTNIQIFPTPDANGPASGNYILNFEGYTRLSPVVPTTGTTVGTTATLTVPSTGYLTSRGLLTAGSSLSVETSGYLGPSSVNDTLLTSWTAFPTSATVTMADNAQVTNANPVNVYFNSVNWVISNFDQVLLFGVLREIAAYLKENFQTWEQRFQMAMESMAQADVDRRKSMEMQGVGRVGQQTSELLGRWGFERGWGDWF